MKIIFLDIDGVLNFESHYRSKGFTNYRNAKRQLKKDVKSEKIERLDYYRSQINIQALKRIERLCKRTKASIVISSTWRLGITIEEFHEIFDYCGLTEKLPIIGTTPHFHVDIYGSLPRGCEIKHWLEKKGFKHINWSTEEQQKYIDSSGIENYIIIDDDSDMLYNQRNHFVHIYPFPRNSNGFSQAYYKIAVDKLSKTVIELNFQ